MTRRKHGRQVQKTTTKDSNRSATAKGRKKIAPATEMREATPSCFSKMPLDVLYLIFGSLGPHELLILARTNREFRQTLLANNAKPIWKSARMRWPGGSPDCPPDVSEARWADLLFGDAKCDRTFPDYDKSILELIPSGNAGCRSQFWERKKCQYYWDADIQNMAKQVATYREVIESGKAGAEDTFLSFKSAHIAHVEDVIEHAQVCLDWLEEQGRLRRKQVRRRIKARRNAWNFERLAKRGWERQDFEDIESDVLNVDAELTDDAWDEARKALEPIIALNRGNRLMYERRMLHKNIRYEDEWLLYACIPSLHYGSYL
ncbi:hypothetical protein WOLCODRAFT_150533 [Wolfiporia cocos MD-104 SS10]|uniref:F-box domain-containing protein n=1 Tax=Wolfiporia cocos (strain MD-104) TaxID=742152 RepID=A0A2H3JE13_WOLCO|nr:hypothetical protein WOLCODRAFT_150533 [Wolfiporia cocos MD-104 SS10]